jgi:xanthine dehydrogenase accessory factor
LGPVATLGQRLPLHRFDAAVVMSHHLESDAAYLTDLAMSPIPRIGLPGPRARRERLLGMVGPVGAEGVARTSPRARGP